MAMTPTHIVTGMAIGAILNMPLISIPAAFVSHFIFDLYPEWGNQDEKVDKIDIFSVLLEISLGIIAVYALYSSKNWELWACAISANLVDL